MDTIVHLLDTAAERYSARTALGARRGYRTVKWTYARLNHASHCIAAHLRYRGVHKGDRVIIWAANSPEWVAAFFGCLRAGAVVVPLDVRSTVEFARKVAAQTTPKLAFVSSVTVNEAAGLGVPLAEVEELESLLKDLAQTIHEAPVGPDDVAEVVFTSGATGDPKGVVLTHGNIVSNVKAATQVVPCKPSYRLLSLLPLSHMLEQNVGLLAPLTGGGAVYYPASRQSTVVFRALHDHRITTLLLVPQALKLFMDAVEARVKEQGKERLWQALHRVAPRLPLALRRRLFGQVHRRLGGAFKFVICGGAYLDPALAMKWEALGVPVLQGYGTTEASPIIACNSFRHRKLDSVGRPVPGVQVRLADDGEIQVRGPNVTQGYWRNPEATGAAFAEGWYNTGDLGAFDHDGFLHFKGRKKDLIVLATGLNVYPDDIEAALKKQPQVADAIVVGLPQSGQEVQVHAVLLVKGSQHGVEQMVEQVNAGLAEHQRIRDFTVWPEDDFPRTHTLKVKKHEVLARLRAGLPTAPQATGRDGQSTVPPLVRLVARLAQRPAEQVKGSARLGADLGLDSLSRVELLAAIETELGAYLDESQVSGDTTVTELEALVARAGKAPKEGGSWSWPLKAPARAIRTTLQALVAFPLLRLVAPLRVTGKENLRGLGGPVLFAANHSSHLDTPVALAALPWTWRANIAVAAAADFWFSVERWKALFSALLFNAFPFSRTDSIRASLEECSRLLDRGWSILIYPEGTRTKTGEMGPFKSGTGMMAVELGVPVVPVHISGTYYVLPKDEVRPRRGRVSVRFGQPLTFAPGSSYLDATRVIEEAVRRLGAQDSEATIRKEEARGGA